MYLIGIVVIIIMSERYIPGYNEGKVSRTDEIWESSDSEILMSLVHSSSSPISPTHVWVLSLWVFVFDCVCFSCLNRTLVLCCYQMTSVAMPPATRPDILCVLIS